MSRNTRYLLIFSVLLALGAFLTWPQTSKALSLQINHMKIISDKTTLGGVSTAAAYIGLPFTQLNTTDFTMNFPEARVAVLDNNLAFYDTAGEIIEIVTLDEGGARMRIGDISKDEAGNFHVLASLLNLKNSPIERQVIYLVDGSDFSVKSVFDAKNDLYQLNLYGIDRIWHEGDKYYTFLYNASQKAITYWLYNPLLKVYEEKYSWPIPASSVYQIVGSWPGNLYYTTASGNLMAVESSGASANIKSEIFSGAIPTNVVDYQSALKVTWEQVETAQSEIWWFVKGGRTWQTEEPALANKVQVNPLKALYFGGGLKIWISLQLISTLVAIIGFTLTLLRSTKEPWLKGTSIIFKQIAMLLLAFIITSSLVFANYYATYVASDQIEQDFNIESFKRFEAIVRETQTLLQDPLYIDSLNSLAAGSGYDSSAHQTIFEALHYKNRSFQPTFAVDGLVDYLKPTDEGLLAFDKRQQIQKTNATIGLYERQLVEQTVDQAFYNVIYAVHPQSDIINKIYDDDSPFIMNTPRSVKDNAFYGPSMEGEVIVGIRGDWIYAMGPIVDAEGQIIALYQTGVVQNDFFQEYLKDNTALLRTSVINELLAMAAVIALITLILLRDILKLKRGVIQLAQGHYDVNVTLKRQDEIGDLSTHIQELAKRTALVIDNMTRQTDAYYRFVPERYAQFIGKSSILEVGLADSAHITVALWQFAFHQNIKGSTITEPSKAFAPINDYYNLAVTTLGTRGVIDHFHHQHFLALFDDASENAMGVAIAFNEAVAKEGSLNTPYGMVLHSGDVLLGFIGGEMRLQQALLSDAIADLEWLTQLTALLGATLLMTEPFAKRQSGEDLTKSRFLGYVQLPATLQRVELYDVYETDTQRTRHLKEVNRSMFERGVTAFYDKDLFTAQTAFVDVLKSHPEDLAARLYFYLCNAYITHSVKDIPDVMDVKGYQNRKGKEDAMGTSEGDGERDL